MSRIIFSVAVAVSLSVFGATRVDAKGGRSGGGNSGGGNSGGHSNSSFSRSSSSFNHNSHNSHNNHKVSFNNHNNHNNHNQFRNNNHNQFHNKHVNFGTRFSHGYSFRGRPNFWGQRCWNPTYSCYTYYCPSSFCHYYWCAPYQCYYPISYCPTGVYYYEGDGATY